ncbi:MAG: hypothetical protein ABIU29_01415 [Chthoniobacterales bacterium]
MQTKSIHSAGQITGSAPVHHFGTKALYLEPLLILGSSLFWLVVLPFVGLFYSAAVLLRRAEGLA